MSNKRHTLLRERMDQDREEGWVTLKTEMMSLRSLIQGELKVMALLSIKAYEAYYLSIGFGSSVARQDAEAAVRIELDPDWSQLVDMVAQDIDREEMMDSDWGEIELEIEKL